MTNQLGHDDLAGMTHEEIAQALDDGRFHVLLGGAPEDAALIARAGDPDQQEFTTTEVRRLRQLGRHDLVANLTATQIKE